MPECHSGQRLTIACFWPRFKPNILMTQRAKVRRWKLLPRKIARMAQQQPCQVVKPTLLRANEELVWTAVRWRPLRGGAGQRAAPMCWRCWSITNQKPLAAIASPRRFADTKGVAVRRTILVTGEIAVVFNGSAVVGDYSSTAADRGGG